MPKIIENVRQTLLSEAKKQITERGYAGTTVRSVAAACGLGVGTVYNYFPSKDMLIASFMAEEWFECLERMKKASGGAENVLRCVCAELKAYSESYRGLFKDTDAAKVFATVFAERHKQLRNQIAELVLPLCTESSVNDKAFLADYIAESLLSWIVSGKDFAQLYPVIKKLLK